MTTPTRPPLIDDGFLDEPEPRLPHHPPSRPRRIGCSVFVVAILVLVGSIAAPRPSSESSPALTTTGAPWTLVVPSETMPVEPASDGVGVRSSGDHQPSQLDPDAAGRRQPETAKPSPAPLAAVTLQGTWAWAAESHGPRYLAIPQGPGWRVVVCGPAACLDRVSTDAGPVLSLQRQGRIGDLSARDFETLCAMTSEQRRAIGLCPGSLTITGRARLPETSEEEPR